MLNIQDKVFVSLKIDGTEVEYAGLISIIGTEGNGALIPALKISISDPLSLFSSPKSAITEGNEVEISLARSHKDNTVRPRKYRVFSVSRGNQAFNPTMDIVCIVNSPKYISKSSIESYKGSSETVLNQLATKCGLTFSGQSSLDGRTPNDSQTWLNVCRNRATFAQDVVKHGWIDPHSGMSASVTSYGELRYRDLIALINTPIDKIQYVFMHSAPLSSTDNNRKLYFVKEARDRSSAGVMTSWQNYGSTRVQNKLTGDVDAHKELAVKMPGSYLPINSSVSGQIDRSRIEYAPLDCGNVHNNYEVAQYQNTKLNALFTEKMSLLMDSVTEVQLYDVIIYRQEDADLRQPVKNTDIYIVLGKTYAISGGVHYAERIELARMSLTMSGSTSLEKPGNFASERSMIPDVTVNAGSTGVLAAANRANATSLSGLVSGVSTGNSMLDGLKNSIASPLVGIAGRLDGVKSLVSNGLASPSTITGMLQDARILAASAVDMKSVFSFVSNANGGLLSSLVGQASGVKSSLISQTNGITTSLVNQYAVAMPMQAVCSAMQSTLGIMPADVVKASGDYSILHSTLSGTASDIATLTGGTNSQWNKTLGTLRGVTAPSSFSNSTPQFSVNLQQGLKTPSMSDVNLLGVVNSGLSKDYNGSPSWLSPTALSPTSGSSAASSIDEAKSYSNRLMANLS
jgi:hypothetical protein